jgi:membrane protein DedA with SNARE-associated domain
MFKKIFSFVPLLLFSLNFFAQESTTTEPQPSTPLIKQVEQWYDSNINYTTIVLLMTVESSFIPFPSEIIIPPAAYIASKPNSRLSIYLVVLSGTLGSLIGAFINYFLALWLGRIIIYKFADSKLGHLCLLNSDKIKKAEAYFNDHGKISTFVGRLIPGIRQLISIPAGLAKMNFLSFVLYTALGAGIWNTVLALLGYVAQGQQDLIDRYSRELSCFVLVFLALTMIYFVIKHYIKKKKHNFVR